MIKKWEAAARDIVKGYFLEFIVAGFSLFLVFVDAGFFENNKFFVAIPGIFLVVISTIAKIKDGYHSRDTHALIDDLQGTVAEKDKRIEEAHSLIKEQKQKTEERSQKLQEQNDLITRLIKQGLISEKDIYDIVQKDKFFYLFCYQNVPDQINIQKTILKKDFRNPSLEAVEEIGFIKVGTRSNLYVIPINMLPKKLQTEERIEKLLRKLVKEKWRAFLSDLETTNKAYYDTYLREGDPTNCTYMIVSSNFHDVLMNFVGYNSFSRQFKDMLRYNVDIKKLRKEISKRKHAIKEFVKSISHELLFADISVKNDVQILKDNIEKVSKNLKVDNFLGFSGRKEDLNKELSSLFSAHKAKKYSNFIASKSEKYSELFYILGIEM